MLFGHKKHHLAFHPHEWIVTEFSFFSVNLFFKDISRKSDLFLASKAGLHTFKRSFPGFCTSISRVGV